MKPLSVVLLILLVTGCYRFELSPAGCGVSNPLTDLPWLVSMVKDSTLDLSITQATYQQETVYLVSSCSRYFAGPKITNWKRQALDGMSSLLETTPSKPALSVKQRAQIEAPLFQQIGQVKVKNDYLKKKLRTG